jgi:EAL domain-containing protein (putative c-di-GMP-specific phosphodiesterase class I)
MPRRVVPRSAGNVLKGQPPPTRAVDTGGADRGFILESVAESIGAEVQLSRLLRRRAVELVAGRSAVGNLFLNTHPSEIADPRLIESIEDLRRLAPRLDLTLEIHESALAQPTVMAL